MSHRAVPLSKNLNLIWSQSAGVVVEGLFIVVAADIAVRWNISYVSFSGVKDALFAAEYTLAVILLFVRVFVLEIVGTVTHSTAITQADTRESVVSVACQSSIVVPIVATVQIFNALAALIPPDVLIAPVVDDVVSSVLGANIEADAPVPQIVKRVVAPAQAVKDVEAVVTLVVCAGEVIVCTPVKV